MRKTIGFGHQLAGLGGKRALMALVSLWVLVLTSTVIRFVGG